MCFIDDEEEEEEEEFVVHTLPFKVVLRPKKKIVFPLDFKTMLTKH